MEKTDWDVRDPRESNITQILSQRLGNMEQQLVLLRGDLKDAVETLKKKDQEITTLENKIALAERRREAEKNGSPHEDLRDLSEDIDPESKSKHELLQKECNTLAQKLQEMEKFFGDYGLAWVKEDALDENDPNNLWVRKTNIHYTPDFDKIFVVVEELNLNNVEPQIVKTGNTAQFKNADLLNLSLYADGIQLENNPFRPYDSSSVEEFFQDLEDGYFPSELKGKHPEGVIFKVRDMRSTKFADDRNRRPVLKRGQNGTSSPHRTSASSVSRGSQKSSPGLETDQGQETKSGSGNDPNMNGGEIARRSRFLSRKGRASNGGSIIKNVAKTSTEAPKAGSKIQPMGTSTPAAIGNMEKGEDIKPARSEGPGDLKSIPGETEGIDSDISPGKDSRAPDNAIGAEGTGGRDVTEAHSTKTNKGDANGFNSKIGNTDSMKTPEAAVDSHKLSPGSGSNKNGDANNASSDRRSSSMGLKQLYVAGQSPQVSSTRVPKSTNEHNVELDKELTTDSFGLPRPPTSISTSDRLVDVQKPVGPPSMHFDNFFLSKTGETQTSGTYVVGQAPQALPPSTHVTNITYNEAPITIQMTPSELKGDDQKTIPPPTPLKICPVHHPHSCTCAYGMPLSDSSEEEGVIGSVDLIKITGETEYREKYTEGAMNTKNVWQQKKRSQERNAKEASPSPVLATRNIAPIPPDPVQMGTTVDPNVHWPNFVYFGHPKEQEASPPIMAKKKSESPQIIQLNEKTSDRMIVVKMRTRSGHKEFNANVYPEEPIKKLWSLLKLNNKEYNLTSTQAPHLPLTRGSIGEHSKDNAISLVLSETKTNNEPTAEKAGSASAIAQSPKSKSGDNKWINDGISKTPGSLESENELSHGEGERRISNRTSRAKPEVPTTSKEGSNASNVNINIDSHASYGVREEEKNVDQTKQEPLSQGKQKTTKEEDGSGIGVTEVSYQSVPQKKRTSQFSIPITPKTRAKALSEQLSLSSLHKKSFQSTSYRDSPVKGAVHKEPFLVHNEGRSSKGSQRTAGSKEFTRSSPHSSTGRVLDTDGSRKNLSNKGVRTSKQSIQSLTKLKPKTITSSKSLKLSNKKTSSKNSLDDNRLSVPKLSIEKKSRKGSSKLNIPQGDKKKDSLLTKSDQSPLGSSDIKIVIHSPTPVREEIVDQEQGRVGITDRKSSGGSIQGQRSPVPQTGESGKRSDSVRNRGSSDAGSVHVPNEKRSSVSRKASFGSKKSISPPRSKQKTTLTEKHGVEPKTVGTTNEKHDKVISSGVSDMPADIPFHGGTEQQSERNSEHEVVTPTAYNVVKETSNVDTVRGHTPSKLSTGTNETTLQNILQKKKSSSSPNFDDHPQPPGVDPKIDSERTDISLTMNGDIKVDVEAPNEVPPHIQKSDADLNDDKEATVSSVSHDPKFDYDKHDSEQEFVWGATTDTTKLDTIVENKTFRNTMENIDKPEDQTTNMLKTKSMGGRKNTSRKSLENEEGVTTKHENSQERGSPDGSESENAVLTSPAVSVEDIEPNNTEGQKAGITSVSSLS